MSQAAEFTPASSSSLSSTSTLTSPNSAFNQGMDTKLHLKSFPMNVSTPSPAPTPTVMRKNPLSSFLRTDVTFVEPNLNDITQLLAQKTQQGEQQQAARAAAAAAAAGGEAPSTTLPRVEDEFSANDTLEACLNALPPGYPFHASATHLCRCSAMEGPHTHTMPRNARIPINLTLSIRPPETPTAAAAAASSTTTNSSNGNAKSLTSPNNRGMQLTSPSQPGLTPLSSFSADNTPMVDTSSSSVHQGTNVVGVVEDVTEITTHEPVIVHEQDEVTGAPAEIPLPTPGLLAVSSALAAVATTRTNHQPIVAVNVAAATAAAAAVPSTSSTPVAVKYEKAFSSSTPAIAAVVASLSPPKSSPTPQQHQHQHQSSLGSVSTNVTAAIIHQQMKKKVQKEVAPTDASCQSMIECGEILSNGKRLMLEYVDFFGKEVEIYTATNDPTRQHLYRASALAEKFGYATNKVGMYLARRRSAMSGIYQATSFRSKPPGRTGLKAGGYFLTISACQEFENHFRQHDEMIGGMSGPHCVSRIGKREDEDEYEDEDELMPSSATAAATVGPKKVHEEAEASANLAMLAQFSSNGPVPTATATAVKSAVPVSKKRSATDAQLNVYAVKQLQSDQLMSTRPSPIHVVRAIGHQSRPSMPSTQTGVLRRADGMIVPSAIRQQPDGSYRAGLSPLSPLSPNTQTPMPNLETENGQTIHSTVSSVSSGMMTQRHTPVAYTFEVPPAPTIIKMEEKGVPQLVEPRDVEMYQQIQYQQQQSFQQMQQYQQPMRTMYSPYGPPTTTTYYHPPTPQTIAYDPHSAIHAQQANKSMTISVPQSSMPPPPTQYIQTPHPYSYIQTPQPMYIQQPMIMSSPPAGGYYTTQVTYHPVPTPFHAVQPSHTVMISQPPPPPPQPQLPPLQSLDGVANTSASASNTIESAVATTSDVAPGPISV